MDLVSLFLVASATALATGLGALPVFFMGARAELLRPVLLGTAIGAMTVASLVGLLKPAVDEGSTIEVVAGLFSGVLLLVAARRLLAGRDVHVGALRGAGVRLSVLVFGVLLVHSLPEGLAIGTAYASDLAGLSLFVILAIGLQNIPEGTSVAIPMSEAGFSRSSQFWAAVLTSAPQPIGAVLAFLVVEHVQGLLPASFAFAAGAMLALAHDQRVMRADRGFFCLPEVDIRIPFTHGMNALIAARLSKHAAHEAMTTGRRYGGLDAQTEGIVDLAVEEGQVRPRAIELAAALASKDPATLATIKRRLYEAPLAALRDRGANALVGAG